MLVVGVPLETIGRWTYSDDNQCASSMPCMCHSPASHVQHDCLNINIMAHLMSMQHTPVDYRMTILSLAACVSYVELMFWPWAVCQ